MKKTVAIVGILALIGFGVFAYLGGLKDFSIEEAPGQELLLYGLTYEGTPQDEQLRKTFERVEAAKEAVPDAIMHTIYEVEPAGKLDTMRVFVGLDKELKSGEVGWEKRVVFGEKILVADLNYHKLVMPRPEAVKKAIRDYAEENGLVLKGMFVDRLLAADHVQVMAPVEE
ncbi:hypothetical protein GCM10028791_20970 [Echinicola sediminis]